MTHGETEAGGSGGAATWLAAPLLPPDPADSPDAADPAGPSLPSLSPDRLGEPSEAGAPGGRDRRKGSGRNSGRKGSQDSADLDADPEAVARQICLRMLTAAPRTRAQLAAALHRRGVPDEAAETVLERFADVQLIDDAMFARAWVESRHHGRGLARRALAAELRQRGVEAGDIQAAVADLDPDQEAATARALVQRRVASTRGLTRPARFRRLMGMLARKGYSEGLAYRIVREALDAEPADSAPDGDDLPEPEPDDDQGQW
jgi:regulatory protein